MCGHISKAFKLLPCENPPEKSWQVPLFVPNYYFGLMDSPNFGHSSQHHSTGTAAWLVMDYFLGVRATVDGLVIDPCIPKAWKEFIVKRKYKNAYYSIKIVNSSRAAKGVKSIYVNGKAISGNILPYEKGVDFYEVEVFMESLAND